jgi:peptidoglycan/LPS O-acetylase OafA/YrhL
MSYSLYLWQQLFFVLGVAPASLPLGAIQRWPIAPLAVFAFASLSHYIVEQPCIALGKRLSVALVGRTARASGAEASANGATSGTART